MGLLFIVVLGISALIVLAILAGRTLRPKEPPPVDSTNGKEPYPLLESPPVDVNTIDALIYLLVSKGLIKKEELDKAVLEIRKAGGERI